jgi:hypothetical protein
MRYLSGALSKAIIPFAIICMTLGCTRYQFASKKDSAEAKADTVILDSNQVYVPSEYRKPYVVGHGVLFAILGFFAGGYLTYTWGNGLKIGEECEDCHSPGLFWIGGGIGFIGGYIFGIHVGSRVAKIKYRERQQRNDPDVNKENIDSTDTKKVFDKSKL